MATKKELREVQKYGMTKKEYDLEKKAKGNIFSKLYIDKEPWQVFAINAGLAGSVGLGSVGLLNLISKRKPNLLNSAGGGSGNYSGSSSVKKINEIPVNKKKVNKEIKEVINKSSVSLGDINKIEKNLENKNYVWEF